MSADSKNPSNVPEVTRNENLDPQIGWASRVPDNHCHKSSRHVTVRMGWGWGALQTTHAEMGGSVLSQVTEAKPTDAVAKPPATVLKMQMSPVVRLAVPGPVKIFDLRNLIIMAKITLVTFTTNNSYFPVQRLNTGRKQKCKRKRHAQGIGLISSPRLKKKNSLE